MKIAAWIVGAVFGLLLLLWVLVQFPSVQNFLVRKITQSLSKTLQTDIKIGRVDFKLIKSIQLENIYAEDRNQDTLLSIDQLSASIGLFSLLQQKILLDDINIKGLHSKLYRQTADSTFNFQFIIDHYTPAVPADSLSAGSSPWDIQFGEVTLEDSRFSFMDSINQVFLKTELAKIYVDAKSVDFNEQSLQLNSFSIENPLVNLEMVQISKPDSAVSSSSLVFPYTGWDFASDQLEINQGNIRYWVVNKTVATESFDAEHLHFKALSLNIENFSWDADKLSAELNQLVFQERSGLDLEDTHLQLEMTPQKIAVADLRIKTAYSELANQTSLSFNSWEGLNDFVSGVNLESNFTDSRIAYQDLDLFLNYLPEDYKIKETIQLSGQIRKEQETLRLGNLKLRLGNILELESSGNAQKINDPAKLTYAFQLKTLNVNFKQLREALPVLKLPENGDSLGQIRIVGNLNGTADKIQLQKLNLRTTTGTAFNGSGNIQNLSTPDNLRFNLNIENLQTTAKDLAYFSTAALPPGLYHLQQISYQGLLTGGTNDFSTEGKWQTALGNLDTDLSIRFNRDYSNATYEGDLALNAFDLGRFLEDTLTFGKASLNLSVDGRGISPDSLNASIEATANSIVFNSYNYQNIGINGQIDRMKFTGLANMKDPNLSFDFAGEVDMNEVVPVFRFDLNLDTLSLTDLNLSEEDFHASAVIKSDFSGKNIDSFVGEAALKNINLSSDQYHFHTDSILLTSRNSRTNEKQLNLNSDFINGKISGDFRIVDLPALLRNFVNDFFPVDRFLSPQDQPDSLALEPFPQTDLPDQNLAFTINIYEPHRLSRLFTPALEKLDSLNIQGRFDSKNKSLDLTLQAPLIEVSGWTIDDLRWTVKGDVTKLNSTLFLPEVGNGAMAFSQNTWSVTLADQAMETRFAINNEDEVSVLQWGAKAIPTAGVYQIELADSLLVNQYLWRIEPTHLIEIDTNYLKIENLFITKGEQSLAIKSYDKPIDKDYTPIEVKFDNFKLSEISGMTDIEGFQYQGLVNGTILLNDITENLHYNANAEVNNFVVNDSLIGNIKILAEQAPPTPVINVSVNLSGRANQLAIAGDYNIDTGVFDLEADIKQVPLILLDPFSQANIKNSEGYLKGNFKVKGQLERPDINGQLTFKDASTRISYLQTRYRIPDHTISVDNRKIDFGRMQLFDAKNNQAVLSGNILHQNLNNIRFELTFDTEQFNFLNTKAKDNNLFYGTLNLAARVEIRGPLELPEIEITARTLTDSKLYVSAVVDESLGQQEDYIIYGKPGELPLDSVLNERSANGYQAPEIDLLLNLELTPQAELVVIIDPLTGDQLSSTGNANLSVELSPGGNVSINGLYTATKGYYQLNYQGLVKRRFELVAGSTLNFTGDPLDTRFDLTAEYKTRTSLYPLVSNEASLSESAILRAKDRTDVSVLMNMSGDLDRPVITFDLSIDDLNSSELENITDRKLLQLREDEAELNKQVFGLLLLNSFVAEQSATASLSTSGENIALSSVSNLISNQLNRLSEQYVKGLGLSFDLESYKAQFDDGTDNTTTNLNVGLTQSLFNDRLTLKVGGVVQMESNSGTSEGSGFSNIAGDFVLEYQIDKAGRYLLRVFQRSDYDAFDNSNVYKTGVGIEYKKSFGE